MGNGDLLTILQGDALEKLRELPDESVQCCVTSPPFWGLRDYGCDGQIGLEKTPEEYIAKMVEVFSEVRRVLRKHGTLWLNLGDSYWGDSPPRRKSSETFSFTWNPANTASNGGLRRSAARCGDLKAKDLCGIPWMVAFALRADGWWLRSDIIWNKPNCMPESVLDRPTRSHEYLFLLTKSGRYYYDAEAVREPPSLDLLKQIAEGYNGKASKDFLSGMAQDASATKTRIINGYRKRIDKQRGHSRRHDGFNDRWYNLTKEEQMACGSNKRDVWTIAPANYPEAHFATYPPDLIKPCILAGTRVGDVILDPFAGSGTTGMVAIELGRKSILIELNPDYVELIKQRCNVTPGLALA